MNSIAVVVEGRSDAILLRRLLGKSAPVPLRFYATEGQASLATIGRNILVHEGGPLIVVMDSDTFDLGRVETSCSLVETALRNVSPHDRFHVVAFVPELEIVFFEAPTVLTRRFGSEIVSPAKIENGHFRPKNLLLDILKSSDISKRETYFKELTDTDLDELRQGAQASSLLSVVEGLTVGVGP